jgi:cyclopropane fatty-acyl-phospholipid synthase-like methyltransferase
VGVVSAGVALAVGVLSLLLRVRVQPRNAVTYWAMLALSGVGARLLAPGAWGWARTLALAAALYAAAFAALELAYFELGWSVWDESERVDSSYQWFDVYLDGIGSSARADLTEGYFARSWAERPEQAMRDKYDALFELLRLRPGMRVLDVGCGYGHWMRYLRSRGVASVGITLAVDQVAYARETSGLDVRLQDARELPDAEYGASFDAVSMLGCLEHFCKCHWPRERQLATYRRVLGSARRALRPGSAAGRVAVTAMTVSPTERWGAAEYARAYLLERHYSGSYPHEGDLDAQRGDGLRRVHHSDRTEDYRWISIASPDHFGNFRVRWDARRALYAAHMLATDPFAAHKWLYHALGVWMWSLGGTDPTPDRNRPAPCRLKWEVWEEDTPKS